MIVFPGYQYQVRSEYLAPSTRYRVPSPSYLSSPLLSVAKSVTISPRLSSVKPDWVESCLEVPREETSRESCRKTLDWPITEQLFTVKCSTVQPITVQSSQCTTQ